MLTTPTIYIRFFVGQERSAFPFKSFHGTQFYARLRGIAHDHPVIKICTTRKCEAGSPNGITFPRFPCLAHPFRNLDSIQIHSFWCRSMTSPHLIGGDNVSLHWTVINLPTILAVNCTFCRLYIHYFQPVFRTVRAFM